MEVLFLDDDDDLREVMGQFLRSIGHECTAVASHRELMALGDEVHRFEVAILDVNLGAGAASGVDAFRWLRARGFGGRIYFLTGHGIGHPLVAEASRIGEVRVLQKPMGVEALTTLLVADR